MSSFKPPQYNSDVFDSGLFEVGTETLTLDTADARYLKLSGGVVRGNTTFSAGIISNSIVCGDITSSSRIDVNRTSSGYPIVLKAGTSTLAAFHTLDGDAYFGTTTNNNFRIMSNNASRMVISNTGAITGISSLTATNLTATGILSIGSITNVANTIAPLVNIIPGQLEVDKALTLDSLGYLTGLLQVNGDISSTANIEAQSFTKNGVPIVSFTGLITPQTLSFSTHTNVAGMIYACDAARYYGQRLIDTNNYSLMSLSAGGTYNDTLVYTHSATPVLRFNTANGSFRAPTLQADTSVTAPLIDLTSNIGSSTGKTQLKWGSSSSTTEQWYLYSYQNANSSHWNIKNGAPAFDNFGISFGIGTGFSASDGCMMVINGIQGDPAGYISCGISSCNAALHVNAGIPQAVPSGWGYTPTGSSSISGGTVAVSLYTYNNIWVRGNVYCTSDARLKNVVSDIDPKKAMNLLKIKPKWYSWKNDETNTMQLGLLAQDLVKHDLKELTCLFDNDDLEADKEQGIPEKKQLVIAYDKIPLYLLEIVKQQQATLENLESTIEKLSSRPVVSKWLAKQ